MLSAHARMTRARGLHATSIRSSDDTSLLPEPRITCGFFLFRWHRAHHAPRDRHLNQAPHAHPIELSHAFRGQQPESHMWVLNGEGDCINGRGQATARLGRLSRNGCKRRRCFRSVKWLVVLDHTADHGLGWTGVHNRWAMKMARARSANKTTSDLVNQQQVAQKSSRTPWARPLPSEARDGVRNANALSA